MTNLEIGLSAILIALIFVAVLAWIIAHAPLIDDVPQSVREPYARPTADTTTPPPPPSAATCTVLGASVAPKSYKTVRIIKCSDPQYWYADRIGKEFVPEGVYNDQRTNLKFFWTREPAGYRNIVLQADTQEVYP